MKTAAYVRSLLEYIYMKHDSFQIILELCSIINSDKLEMHHLLEYSMTFLHIEILCEILMVLADL